jgi:hypothetical protein
MRVTRRLPALAILLLSSGLLLGSQPAGARQASGDTTVYVTKTGTKYHQAGCSSLSRSAIPMRLDDAVRRYGPCSRCRPPVTGVSPSGPGKMPFADAAPARPTADTPVYLTAGGPIYHLDQNCPGLQGRQRITKRFSDVQTADYGLCSRCGSSSRTRSPGTAVAPPASATAPVAVPQPQVSGRCQAITKKGTQCSRKAQPGSLYCWQHQR